MVAVLVSEWIYEYRILGFVFRPRSGLKHNLLSLYELQCSVVLEHFDFSPSCVGAREMIALQKLIEYYTVGFSTFPSYVILTY